MKIIGLACTPFRTAEAHQLLGTCTESVSQGPTECPAMTFASRSPERRAFYRHLSSGNVICRPGTWRQSPDCWTGDILDASFDGLSICLYRRFEVGTPLLLELQGRNGTLTGAGT